MTSFRELYGLEFIKIQLRKKSITLLMDNLDIQLIQKATKAQTDSTALLCLCEKMVESCDNRIREKETIEWPLRSRDFTTLYVVI